MNLPPVIPAKAGTQARSVGFVAWAPAFAGVTEGVKRLTMLLAVLTLTWSAPAQAQTSSNLRLGAELGAGLLDGDAYTLLLPYLEWSIGKFHTGLNAPLRLRVYDGGQPAAGPTPGLRQEDWNGWSNKTRILRFAEWGEPGEPVHVRLGELNGVTLGHGTIVGRYYNNVDIDHYRTGALVEVDGGVVGGKAFLNSVLDPYLAGGRLFWRPLAEGSTAKTFMIGLSFVGDFGPRPDYYFNTGLPFRPAEFGLDAEVQVWRGSTVAVLSYLDANTLAIPVPTAFGAAGAHLGVLTQISQLPGNTALSVRLEGRVVGPGYVPTYFDSIYDIGRWHALGPEYPLEFHAGGMLGLEFATPGNGLVSVQAEVEPRQGGLLAWVILPEIEGLQLRAHYARRHATSFGDLFDDQTTALASLRYRVDGPIYASILCARRWHQIPGAPWRHELQGGDWPAFATTLELAATVGMDWRF